MQRLQDGYLAAYRSLKLTRDSEGVLVAEFHSNDGPFTFTAQDHTEFVDAFYQIAQDRANKIVILTGAGGEFIPEIDFSSFGNVADPGVWSQVHDEGAQLLENIANIRVPVIGHRGYRGTRSCALRVCVAGQRDCRRQGCGPSTMSRISREPLCRATESLPHGVIAPERDERRRSCSTHCRSRRVPHMNGSGCR